MIKRRIFFNEELHKYTDDVGNPYISSTTICKEYEHLFDENKYKIARACEKIGKNPRHPKYIKYKGKTRDQILQDWANEAIKGCDHGNVRHNYLEDIVKSSTGYNRIIGTNYINDRIYTIDDIIEDHNYGSIDISYFDGTDLKSKYPHIYLLLKHFYSLGAKVYSEIGVYNSEWLVSGLIDILIVFPDNSYIILDWKTNKGDIRFDAGYYEKDNYGNLTDEWIPKDEYFKYPLNKLVQSIGNKYSLQLSIYAYLTEMFGVHTFKGIILCHITRDVYTENDDIIKEHPDWIGLEKVVMHDMPYLKREVIDMISHYHIRRLQDNRD